MSDHMERRAFLKAIGTAAAAGAAGPALWSCRREQKVGESGTVTPAANGPELKWAKAPCRYCGVGCGVEVGVAEGKVAAVRGDVASPVNRGLLCVKGYHLPAILYGEDRLLHPMRRNASGHGFSRIAWDEAIALIAEKFGNALASNGPGGIAMYGSGQWTIFDGYAALKWLKGGMRSNNLEGNARLCMSSAVGGFLTQFQSDEPMGCYEDLDAGDDFVLWGNNMAEMHPVLFSRILERKRVMPGTRIIDLGTRRTPTTDYADLYIEFRPGTDLALANGILHLLFERGMIARDFIEENVVFKRGKESIAEVGYGAFGAEAERYDFEDSPRDSSLAEMRQFLADYSPDRVSALTGVPSAQIRALAELYGNSTRGTVSLWCMGVNQHVRGTWMNNLINDLHLVTGKICRPGSNPFSLTGQSSACGTVREVGTLANRLPADMVVTNPEHRTKAEQIWGLPEGTILAKPGLHTIDMFRALVRGEIKAIWIQTTNPWVTIPNLQRLASMPREDRFIVVSDVYPTPTTDAADLVLPSALWVEREGAYGNSERRTQHWDKMVEPPGEAREDAWQVIQVAKKMGMAHLFPWAEESWHRAMFEEYRSFTTGTGKDLASYDELRVTRGKIWPVVGGKETRYRYAAGHDPYVKKSKGVHFYKAKGFGERAAVWLRPYQPPAESPDAEYPFWLTTGRVLEHWHTGSLTRRVKQLHQAVPAAYVEVNRADATERGIKKGDKVRVETRRGCAELPVEIDGRGKPPRGTIFVPFFDERVLVNLLTLDAMDAISKQPDYKKCAARIVRA